MVRTFWVSVNTNHRTLVRTKQVNRDHLCSWVSVHLLGPDQSPKRTLVRFFCGVNAIRTFPEPNVKSERLFGFNRLPFVVTICQILMKCATQLCGSDFRHSLMLRTLSHAVCLCFYLRSAPPPHIRQVTFLLYYTLPVDEVHFKIKVLL